MTWKKLEEQLYDHLLKQMYHMNMNVFQHGIEHIICSTSFKDFFVCKKTVRKYPKKKKVEKTASFRHSCLDLIKK